MRAGKGADAEALARRHLEARGLEILAANYRCRFGEVDLVARDGDTIAFVEVRLRSRRDFGGAAASIDFAKRRRIEATARHFFVATGAEAPARFDVVLLDAARDDRIEWIQSAWET